MYWIKATDKTWKSFFFKKSRLSIPHIKQRCVCGAYFPFWRIRHTWFIIPISVKVLLFQFPTVHLVETCTCPSSMMHSHHKLFSIWEKWQNNKLPGKKMPECILLKLFTTTHVCPSTFYKHLTRSPKVSWRPKVELMMVGMHHPDWNCCRGLPCCYSSSSLYSTSVESSLSLLLFHSKGSPSSWLLVLISLKVGPRSNGKSHKTDSERSNQVCPFGYLM